jgi:tetratricopeptide (TPR) repeat protein
MRKNLVVHALLALAVIAAPAFTQSKETPPGSTTPPGGGGTTSPGGGGTVGTGSSRTPTQPTPTFPSQQQNQTGVTSPMDIQRPMYLSGKVVVDDGLPPPDPVTMLLVCNGRERPQGYTDSKGRFSISLGTNNAILADASIGSADEAMSGIPGRSNRGTTGPQIGVSERDLMGCELRANLPGYYSDSVNLSGRRMFDNPDVGSIILHRLANVQGFTYSLTTANAPKDARKAYEKGLSQLKKQKYAEAEVQLRKAVDAYPKYAVAWYQLGLACEAEKRPDEAMKAYQGALAADDKYVNPLLRLMAFEVNRQDWQSLLETSNTVIRLNPVNFPEAWFYNSVANLQTQRLDAAEKSAREVLKLDRDHRIPKINHVLGLILAQKQDYQGAAEYIRSYLTAAPNASDADFVRKQLSQIEQLAGARVPQPPQ